MDSAAASQSHSRLTVSPGADCNRRERWIAALVAAVLILASFPQVWFFGRSLVATDQYNPLQNEYSAEFKGPDFIPENSWTKRGLIDIPNIHDPGSEWWQGEPSLIFFRRAVLAGEFPFWDPSAGAGAPAFTSIVPAFLFPPQIVLSLAGATSWQKNVYIFLFFWAATFGTYCLLRQHGITRIGSAAGAVVFLFSGAVQTIAPIHFMAQAIVCLPFLFIATRWFLDQPSWPRTGILASIYAVASLASFPPILLPSFAFTALYFCAAIAVEKRPSWRPLALRVLDWCRSLPRPRRGLLPADDPDYSRYGTCRHRLPACGLGNSSAKSSV